MSSSSLVPDAAMKQEEDLKKVNVKTEQSASDDDQDEEDEDLQWWEQENMNFSSRGEKRWDTLEHNGVMFPPEYVPHGIPLIYAGEEFIMTPAEEEVATMFAVLKEHEYYRNPVFRRNFFGCWREILDKRNHPIRSLELCDFEPIYQWYLREREKKLSRTREEKKKIKEQEDLLAEPYRYCLWNGKKEQVANFRVEPPGLFRGRGKHPMIGKLKKRIEAEDITLNMSAGAPIPTPPPGHKWGSIQHDNTVTWLAMWRDSVLGSFKYVMLAPSSSVKGQSDMLKFEKARNLKNHVDFIRESYSTDFKSRDRAVAQRAVAMYFIDKLALRVGNEKGSDEADTVGCCSLRVEHIKLLPDNVVSFDFLGKDSIRYLNDVVVLPEVYELLKTFTRGKRPGEDIFDLLKPAQLNEHLKSFMQGLSAKVFRTYNASITLDKWFQEKPVDPKASLADKIAYFNKANTEVAILCNHQKSVSKNHHRAMGNLQSKASYTRSIMESLEKAKVVMKQKSVEEAAKQFFAEQDKMQLDWLELYGTPEQKAEYEELMEKRGAPRVMSQKSSSSKKKSKSSGKKERKSKAAAVKDEDDDDEEEETLLSLATAADGKKSAKKKVSAAAKKTSSKSKAKGKGKTAKKAKKAAKPAKAAAKSKTSKPAGKKAKTVSSDDDDIPIAAL